MTVQKGIQGEPVGSSLTPPMWPVEGAVPSRMTDWESRICSHMVAGGSVIVPARIAAWLEQHAGVTSDRRITLRDTDPLAYEVLTALHLVALYHRSGNGTKLAVAQPARQESDTWLTTVEAASVLGVTDRAVRKWIATDRLPAIKHGGRWLINCSYIQIAELTA